MWPTGTSVILKKKIRLTGRADLGNVTTQGHRLQFTEGVRYRTICKKDRCDSLYGLWKLEYGFVIYFNVELTRDMYLDGYHNLTAIDISEVVIQQAKERDRDIPEITCTQSGWSVGLVCR